MEINKDDALNGRTGWVRYDGHPYMVVKVAGAWRFMDIVGHLRFPAAVYTTATEALDGKAKRTPRRRRIAKTHAARHAPKD